ncbi:MAG: Transcription_WhiB [uncultured Quadrisphaera sp.]|uniref:Transcriptional regulator WhiB n=1 Tax=uncultured Quadrisphaera sp. TaxID=904978 RepID=A0A6J4P5W4_9ACTN|nr:MAG: Transcription_WhiB [uncultured Quadrisphaera sp.]
MSDTSVMTATTELSTPVTRPVSMGIPGMRRPMPVEDAPAPVEETAWAPEADASAPWQDLASWQDRALCSQTDPEAFFPEKGGSTREAKRVCLGCDVRVECLEYALANDERFGIWGGLSERERRRVKREAV